MFGKNNKKKYKDKTITILRTKKKEIMKETLEHLKTLGETISEKKIA